MSGEAARWQANDDEAGAARAGGRPLHAFWPMLRPSFRWVLLEPHRRAGGGTVSWHWESVATPAPPTPAELAALRRQLDEALLDLGAELDQREGALAGVSAPELLAAMKRLVRGLVGADDAALAAHAVPTPDGWRIRSWGFEKPAPAAVETGPGGDDAADGEPPTGNTQGETDAAASLGGAAPTSARKRRRAWWVWILLVVAALAVAALFTRRNRLRPTVGDASETSPTAEGARATSTEKPASADDAKDEPRKKSDAPTSNPTSAPTPLARASTTPAATSPASATPGPAASAASFNVAAAGVGLPNAVTGALPSMAAPQAGLAGPPSTLPGRGDPLPSPVAPAGGAAAAPPFAGSGAAASAPLPPPSAGAATSPPPGAASATATPPTAMSVGTDAGATGKPPPAPRFSPSEIEAKAPPGGELPAPPLPSGTPESDEPTPGPAGSPETPDSPPQPPSVAFDPGLEQTPSRTPPPQTVSTSTSPSPSAAQPEPIPAPASTSPPDAVPQIQLYRVDEVRVRRAADLVLPTRPLEGDSGLAVREARARAWEQARARIPAAFLAPQIRAGWGFRLRGDADETTPPPTWRDAANGRPLPGGESNRGGARLGWLGVLPERDLDARLLAADGRELARVRIDVASRVIEVRTAKEIVVAAPWFAVSVPETSGGLRWRDLDHPRASEAWQSARGGGEAIVLCLPAEASTAAGEEAAHAAPRIQPALVDEASGWALVFALTPER